MKTNYLVLKNRFIFLLLLISSVASGQTNTWNGTSDTNWNNTANWSLTQIPTATVDVVIPDTTNKPSIGAYAANAKSVTINNSTLTLADGSATVLTIKENFTNNGALIAGAASTITFDGTVASVIGGTSANAFGNVTINKSTTATTVSSNSTAFSTSGNLTITQGNLILTAIDANYSVGNNLTVSASGTLTHNVDWSTGKLLLVSGNLTIDGKFEYGFFRSHVSMNGINKTIRTGPSPSALKILTLTNSSGTITASGLVTVNDNFWAGFNVSGGSFATGTNTVTAKSSLLNAGGNVLINGGTLNVTGALYAGVSSMNGTVTFSSGILNTDFLNVGDGTRSGTFNHSGGTANIGNLSINATGANAYICTGAPTINISGTWTNNKTFTAATSTVNLTGTSAQTLNGTLSGTTGKFYNLTVNGAGATNSAVLEVANNLTLTNGILNTTTTNLLNITNATATGTSGGNASSFVNGPLKWTATQNATYRFPVGKGSNYLPFVLNTNAATGTTAQVEAFNANSGGSPNLSTVTALSTSEYWSLNTTGTFTTSSVSISRPTAINPLNAIAGGATVNGSYSSFGGTVNATGVTASTAIGSAKFFTFGRKGCIPSSTLNNRYISDVKFLGTLSPDATNSSLYSTGGYGDYRGMASRAKQIQGGVINLNVNVGVTTGNNLSTVKAWVDWNQDGVFNDDITEKVYDTSEVGVLAGNVIFGYVVPGTTLRGVYTIRIRVNSGNETFGPCGNTQNGETEDYSFNVVEFCSARILSATAGQQCGPGPVVLSATATADATSYNWYTDEFSNPIAGQTGNTYTTPSLSVGTYTYYVAANNGICSTPVLTPIKVTVRPAPTIVLTKSAPDICGTNNSLMITSAGDKEQVTVLEDQFENIPTAPLQFVNVIEGNTSVNGVWQLRNTPFIPSAPPYNILKPAISSGYNGGFFANMITDVRQNTDILNNWVTINPLNTTGITDLKMDYDLYYFSEEDDVTRNYLKVQYSLDGLTNWVDLKTYSSDVGVPGRFSAESINLPVVCQNRTALKIRFRLFAIGSNVEWLANIAAIDNVRIYGDRDLPTNLAWSGDSGILYSSSCVGPIPSGGASTVCIKVSDTDMKTKSQFTITASAALSNGCNASGTIVINNNTKIWDATSTTNWNTTNWQPADSKIPPIADKCVIVRTPVILGTGAEGFAKNVTIETGGKLTIKKDQSLTVTDAFISNVPSADVLIESDGNLLQINEGTTINTGAITAKRDIILSTGREQYNYLMSPLEGQSLANIYKDAFGNPVTVPFVLYHNEATNKFYTSSGAYIKGRGLAVKEPAAATFATGTMGATFTGKPTNGAFPYTIINSNTGDLNRGYNLIGNPYPSNINLVTFYTLNGGAAGNMSSTAYFWDNRANNKTAQQGDAYGGQSYGQLNMTTGTGTAGTGDIATTKIPTRYVKTGQAFMVKSKVTSATINFNNTIRTNVNGNPDFFGKNTEKADAAMDRYWLNMITPQNIASNIAVVYFADGNNGFAEDDSRTMGGSDVVYSIVENENVSINGRSNFVNTDVITLGTQHYAAGNYTIALGDKEGIFAAGQNIYLKDRQTGILTNLSEGNYTFAANEGASSGRFEIIYQPESVLATGGTSKEELVIYKDSGDFVVQAQSKKITDLQVFDMNGRLIYSVKPNAVKVTVPAAQLVNGTYLLKIDQGGQVSTKKVIK